MSTTCEHGMSLFEDWCSRCNGSPGSLKLKKKEKEVRMNLTFTYKLNILSGGYEEYEVFCAGDIFCHLSESDFYIFSRMCKASGNNLKEIK